MSFPVRLDRMSHTNQIEMGKETQPPNTKHPKPNDWSKQPHTVAIPLTLKKHTISIVTNKTQFCVFEKTRVECLIGLENSISPRVQKKRFIFPETKSQTQDHKFGNILWVILSRKTSLMIFEGLYTKSLPLFDARVAIESSQFRGDDEL